jgi:hypothetical protein
VSPPNVQTLRDYRERLHAFLFTSGKGFGFGFSFSFGFSIFILKEHCYRNTNALPSTALQTLERWQEECAASNDIPTACVVHGYTALLWRHTQASELQPASLARVLGHVGYVRNWHGFGMGMLRSQMCVEGDQQTRLMRFLQAHGIDTHNTVKEGSL